MYSVGLLEGGEERRWRGGAGGFTFLFDILSLAGPCALGDFAGEEAELVLVSRKISCAVWCNGGEREGRQAGSGEVGAPVDIQIQRCCPL